jgi:3-methyladenine DNA glycosylase Tag
MPLTHFDSIFEQAAQRKGGDAALRDLFPQPKSTAALRRVSDSACLEEMTKCIFRAGFVWRVIENKWEGFQHAFDEFDVTDCSLLGDEDLERLAQDTSIVRNASKIATVPKNARFVLDVREEHGSFARYLANWPTADFVGLWADLKGRGARLGGQTGRYFLRSIGYDSPVLSADVVRALIAAGVVDKEPTSKKGLAATQAAFVAWQDQTQLPMSAISRVLACSQP